MKLKNKNINRGAALVSLLFTLLFFILCTRFIYIQVTGKVDGQVLAAMAEEKYTKKRNIEASRGSILDRNGQAIALDTPAFTVVGILDESLTIDDDKPRHVVDPRETAQKLAPLLNMDINEVEQILTKEEKQVEFGANGRDISFTLKQEIEELELPGIAFIRDYKRYYPNGVFASSLIGYAQKSLDEDVEGIEGQLGLEKSLNDYLKEEDGFFTFQSDGRGLRLPNANEQITSPNNGSNVYLTIDKSIQTFLEDSMNKVVQEYEPSKVIGIVADPKTGEILAVSTRPSFDPNIRNITNYLNDAISYRFEPGSTMKIFTLAAAIEEGVYNGQEEFQSGSYSVPGSLPIRDHNRSGWGKISFEEGVQRSSNVGFAILANEKLGTAKLRQYIDRFGFSEPTGVNVEGEVNSIINYKSERDKLSTAFGQATAVTPIQQIQAATAIANDGKMMQPYIIDKIVDPDTDEIILDSQPTVKGNPISKETANEVLDILETVVTEQEGTGKIYNIDGYQVAGKTGTAQIADPTGGYLDGHGNNVFSFLGMAPKDNPRLVVYIAVQEPKLKDFELGSEPVAAIFNPVMKNSLQYLNIQPVEQKKSTANKSKSSVGFELDSYIGKTKKEVTSSLLANDLQPIIVGKGEEITSQVPKSGSKVLPGERIILSTDGDLSIPDLTGWSLREVMRLMPLIESDLTLEGSGYVIDQSISPGTTVQKNDKLTLVLMPPNGDSDEEEKTDNTEEIINE